MNALSISLNKNIDCQYLCNKIGKILNYYISNNIDLSNKILRIEIKESIDDININPRLEHKTDTIDHSK
jgi:hypothetical protein